MTDQLNSGSGECQVRSRLVLAIANPVLHLGSGPDVLNKICGALHSWNRHAAVGQHLAIAFPQLSPENDRSKGKVGFMTFGPDIEIFGSDTATGDFLAGTVIEGMIRRGMISCRDDDVSGSAGAGVAFIRDRKTEKASGAYLKRLERRDARSGREGTSPPRKALKDIRSESHKGFITAGKGFRVNFFTRTGDATSIVHVNTYGLSSSKKPAYLPCTHPGSLRDLGAMGLHLDAL